MEFFKKKTSIDFLGLQKYTTILSLLMFAFSLFALSYYGLNLGLDFTGGTQIQISFDKLADLDKIRGDLQAAGLHHATVQSYGSSQEVLITLAGGNNAAADGLGEQVKKTFPEARVNRVDFIGPQVGKELATLGILAVCVSLIGTMLYILVRFEYRFAISSTLALIHDPVLILGLFAFFQWEFNLIVLSAILAVIGYSLNDTVVVFDRVRENFRKIRKGTATEIVNAAINQTLSRTIMTSGMTSLVVIALLLYGGESLRGFSIALMIGIIVGTYSSIYIAGAFAVMIGLNRQDFLPKVRKPVDEMP
jgi:preprotein translocase subunit SecF